MGNIVTYLMGKKTFICAFFIGFGAFCRGMNWISDDTLKIWTTLLGSLGLAALRDAQNTAHAQVMDKVTQIAAVQQVASAQVAQVQQAVAVVHEKVEQVQRAQ